MRFGKANAALWQVAIGLLLFSSAYFQVQPMLSEFVETRVCDNFYVNRTRNATNACQVAEITRESSRWLLYLSIVRNVPNAVVACLVGVISDRIGRRFPLILGALGIALETALHAIVVSQSLPIPFLFIGEAVAGFSGGVATVLMGAFAYTADLTALTGRSQAFGVTEGVFFVGSAVGPLLGGLVSDHFGYWIAFSQTSLLCALAFLWFLFLCSESLHDAVRAPYIQWRNAFILGTLGVLLQPSLMLSRWALLLMATSFTFIYTNLVGFLTVVVLYLQYRFTMSDSLVGYFYASEATCKGFALLVVLPLIFRFTRLGELTLIQGSLLLLIVSNILFAVAVAPWQMFVVTIIDGTGNICVPLLRSLISQSVAASEQGRVLSAIAALEALFGLVGPILYQSLYQQTAKHHPNSIFYVMAAFVVIPIILMLFVRRRIATTDSRVQPYRYDVLEATANDRIAQAHLITTNTSLTTTETDPLLHHHQQQQQQQQQQQHSRQIVVAYGTINDSDSLVYRTTTDSPSSYHSPSSSPPLRNTSASDGDDWTLPPVTPQKHHSQRQQHDDTDHFLF